MNYNKHIKKNSFIRITLLNAVNVYGFFMNDIDEHIAIIVDLDFFVDGYKIIKKTSIKSIRYTEHEKFYEKLYAINTIKLPSKKIEKNLSLVAHDCMKQQEIVIIETFKKKEYSFDLWLITKISSDYCILKPISWLWKYEKEKKIALWKIDIFSRWNKYSQVFEKYIFLSTSKK